MNKTPNPEFAPANGIFPSDAFEYPQDHDRSCKCLGLGTIDLHWVEKRPWKCTCEAGTDDLFRTLHSVTCDSVPCPFGDI